MWPGSDQEELSACKDCGIFMKLKARGDPAEGFFSFGKMYMVAGRIPERGWSTFSLICRAVNKNDVFPVPGKKCVYCGVEKIFGLCHNCSGCGMISWRVPCPGARRIQHEGEKGRNNKI